MEGGWRGEKCAPNPHDAHRASGIAHRAKKCVTYNFVFTSLLVSTELEISTFTITKKLKMLTETETLMAEQKVRSTNAQILGLPVFLVSM